MPRSAGTDVAPRSPSAARRLGVNRRGNTGGSRPTGAELSRRERQQREIALALDRRQYARVLVLAREHLAEFPEDGAVRAAAAVAREARESDNSDREERSI
jgi:hypothetical protein